uniref:basic proline-rich protein-like n=1 Tax=Halichoerus grypus TaxID=9711 RepID=UPI001658D475|nr:basic proline-rich protein-like [Halichoerus grypus]
MYMSLLPLVDTEAAALFAHAARHLAAAPLPAGPLSPPTCSPSAKPPAQPSRLLPPALPARRPPAATGAPVTGPAKARAEVRLELPPLAAGRPGPARYLGTPLPLLSSGDSAAARPPRPAAPGLASRPAPCAPPSSATTTVP